MSQKKSWLSRYRVAIGIVLCITALVPLIQWWEGRGEGFRIYKIQDPVPYEPRWNLSVSEPDVLAARQILKQPFRYLGHGFQCYVFESEDGAHVIKFFRYHRLRLPGFILSLPDVPLFSEWRKMRLLGLQRRREYLLRSFKASWEFAKNETALVYMQLNRCAADTFPPVVLKDLLGNEYCVNVNEMQFMVQKKASHIKPLITRLVHAGDLDGAKLRIDQIFSLLLHCSERGIQDTDGALIRKNNLGFLADRAIYIDGGKIVFKKRLRSVKSFTKDLQRLQPLFHWIEKEHPSLREHYIAAEQRALSEYAQFLKDRAPL